MSLRFKAFQVHCCCYIWLRCLPFIVMISKLLYFDKRCRHVLSGRITHTVNANSLILFSKRVAYESQRICCWERWENRHILRPGRRGLTKIFSKKDNFRIMFKTCQWFRNSSCNSTAMAWLESKTGDTTFSDSESRRETMLWWNNWSHIEWLETRTKVHFKRSPNVLLRATYSLHTKKCAFTVWIISTVAEFLLWLPPSGVIPVF